MKRRNFIKLTSSASALGLFPYEITSALKVAENFLDCNLTNRKLVLINLAGGNDGLNTTNGRVNLYTSASDAAAGTNNKRSASR